MCYRNIKVNQTKSNMVLCFSWGCPLLNIHVGLQFLYTSKNCCGNLRSAATLFFSRALVLTLGLNQCVQSHKEEQSTERQAGRLFALHSCVSLMCCIIKSKCFWLISCCCFFYCDHLKYVHACFRFTLFL